MTEDLKLVGRLVGFFVIGLALAIALGALAGLAVRVFIAASGLGGG
jgi:hypothetical protein